MADVINFASLMDSSGTKLPSGVIKRSDTKVDYEIAPERSAEPIKSLDDIYRVSEYLVSKERWRDNMLFIVGINFGLRASDLLVLRFCNLINENDGVFSFKDSFPVFEKKTRNTRKRKQNRYITINSAVREAVTLYLRNTPNVTMNDYLFKNQSNHKTTEDKPLTLMSAERILKGITKDLDLNIRTSTHTLRKTFCYHQMLMSNNDSRKLLLLQKMLGHATSAQTLDYIGITGEEIESAYKALNLGSSKGSYLVDSEIVASVQETEIV